MIELCILISSVLGIYDCDWRIEIVENHEVLQTMWEYRTDNTDYVSAFTAFDAKKIVLQKYALDEFVNEWRHAFCYTWYYYHEKHNHEKICEPFPHFKIQI